METALECASFPGEPGYEEMVRGMTVARLGAGESRTRLVTTEFFVVDELRAGRGDVVAVGGSGVAGANVAMVMIDGEGEIIADGGGFLPVGVRKGDTALLPAAIAPMAVLAAGEGARVLVAHVR